MTIGSPAPVVLTTRSAAANACGSSSHGGRGRATAGQFFRPSKRRLTTVILPNAFLLQISQALLGHLAGADHQGLLIVEAFEDLPGEIGHGHAGHAHPPLVDGRFARPRAAPAQRRLKHSVHQRPSVVLLGGRLVGRFTWDENLRFAEYHAVETSRHGEQVLHRRLVAVLIELLGHLGRVQTVEAGQELAI